MAANPFRRAHYLISAHRLDQLPPDKGVEIAFAGRSNAGKSSALNVICDQHGLARTSRTPGRTQQMVVFPLETDDRRLVDLPGYGYAKVPEAMRQHWRTTIDRYLHERESLVGVVVIVDSRHPLKEFDRSMIEFAVTTGRHCHCLLTKADKLSRSEASRSLAAIRRELADFAPAASAQLFSSLKKTGLDEARSLLADWLTKDRAAPLSSASDDPI